MSASNPTAAEIKRRDEIWAAKNQIREILAKTNSHLELGVDPIAGRVFYLCANEKHELWMDAGIERSKQK